MVSTEQFRDGMARLTGAVNVITTDGIRGFAGITATAVCSVSDQPPSLLVCINRASYAYPFFAENGVLSVNVLRASQQSVARTFADRQVSMAERRERVAMRVLSTGSPVIDDTLVSFDCRITSMQQVGSHAVLLCEVEALRVGVLADGLVYFGRSYHPVGSEAAIEPTAS